MTPSAQACPIRRFGASEDGIVGVELALIAALLSVVMLGMIEVTSALHQNVQLQQAARAGAEFAIKYPSDTAGIEQAVLGATGDSSAGLSVTVTQFCECPDGTSVSCTDTCSGSTPDTFMRVDLSQPASQMLSPTGLMPGVTLHASATMRAK
jgi:Flp pilus assembly protein TadG